MNYQGIRVKIQKFEKVNGKNCEIRVTLEPNIPTLQQSLARIFEEKNFYGYTQHELRFSVRGKFRCSTDSRGVLRNFLPEIERLVWAEMDELVPWRKTYDYIDFFTSQDVRKVNEDHYHETKDRQAAPRRTIWNLWGFLNFEPLTRHDRIL